MNGNGNGNGKRSVGNGNGSGKPASSSNGFPQDEQTRTAAREARSGMGGRMGAGVPGEKSEDFAGSTRRLLQSMRPERFGLYAVVALALVSVTLTVLGPKILGHATDIVFRGILGGHGIDFGDLHRVLFAVLGLYVVAAILAWLQGWLLAGVVQRSMMRLRAEVEDKIHRFPPATSTPSPVATC
jgi:ATP-binding cassette subfamily B protein